MQSEHAELGISVGGNSLPQTMRQATACTGRHGKSVAALTRSEVELHIDGWWRGQVRSLDADHGDGVATTAVVAVAGYCELAVRDLAARRVNGARMEYSRHVSWCAP